LKREPFVEGWEENQCFSLNSRPTALDLPCDVRDYEVRFPNRYLTKLGGWVVAEDDKP
jgi:hypothetical protein